ncbi:MAG: nucleotidyl transferase AbiEii/AbiGii toxin family protein [Candidatus Omnitrophica bacterium]|nr:nucleotidyl transferase AbiEii/AbiGii toxin family protein [Candidatus Omnitrophota bacterium]
MLRLKAPNLYLIGGTALSLRFKHRVSEDLDFFTPKWSKALHRRISRAIKQETGFQVASFEEMAKRGRAKMAVYHFQIKPDLLVKVDVVEDVAPLLHPVGEDGLASVDDIYLRKIRAAIGWTSKTSPVGGPLPGGRQAARDLYDLWYLSERYEPLSRWFPQHFTRADYERLAGWLRGMTGTATVVELLSTAPGCDTKRIRQHMEKQIYEELNRYYVR